MHMSWQGLGQQVSMWAGDGRQEPGSSVGPRGLGTTALQGVPLGLLAGRRLCL